MRDGLYFRVHEPGEYIITTDNTGGVGNKPLDSVYAPNEIVGYFTARVALMENLSLGGHPQVLTIQNFSGESAWKEYMIGIEKALNELELPSLPIIGSSETNFSLKQSAFGVTVIGKETKKIMGTPEHAEFAVVGMPLVGEDVISKEELVLPLPIFKNLLSQQGIFEMIPIGSKGINSEWYMLCHRNQLPWKKLVATSAVNLTESSGPATCVLISYDPDWEDQIKAKTSHYFHHLIRR